MIQFTEQYKVSMKGQALEQRFQNLQSSTGHYVVGSGNMKYVHASTENGFSLFSWITRSLKLNIV